MYYSLASNNKFSVSLNIFYCHLSIFFFFYSFHEYDFVIAFNVVYSVFIMHLS